jgi:hypothetical protein
MFAKSFMNAVTKLENLSQTCMVLITTIEGFLQTCMTLITTAGDIPKIRITLF